MKKVIFIGVVLFLVLAAAAFANRPEIDQALAAYEAIVAEAETLAQKDLIVASDEFTAIDQKAEAAVAAIEAVAAEKEWMIQDAKKSAELRIRFNTAMASVVQKLLKY